VRRPSPYRALGFDRLNIFVPAIMSVGLVFWLLTIVRDLFRWRSLEALTRRATNAGRGTAWVVRGDTTPPDPAHLGFRHRRAYLFTSAALTALAAYIFVGSLLNYLRDDGYVEGVGWLLAAAVPVAMAFLVAGLAAGATYLWWPRPARWVRAIHARTPLSRLPLDLSAVDDEPRWQLTAAASVVPIVTVIAVFLVATDWRAMHWLDETVVDVFERVSELDDLRLFDPLGATVVALTLAAAVAVATLRCRPLAFAYPLSVIAGLVITETTQSIVGRSRPPEGPMAGLTDSFPSGHVVQATLIAGLFPLALAALTGSKRVIWPARLLLGVGVVGGAVHRVDGAQNWPSDVIVGLLIGLSLVIATEWVIAHRAWHRWCRGCVWAPDSHGPPLLGVIDFQVSVQRMLRAIAHVWAAAAVVGLSVLSLTIGIPTDPGESAAFGATVDVPVQLTMAGVMSIGALVSWKWDAVGAVLIAFAAAGLGLFAALEYPPLIAFGLTLALFIPALLLWLGWQHRRRMGEILILAVLTTTLLGATWVGVTAVHDYFYGPTHPASAAPFLPADDVVWVWLGALSSDAVSVTAGLDDPGEADAVLVVTPTEGGPAVRVEVPAADTEPAARFRVEGLRPDTGYEYQIELDGEIDGSRGRGRFRTAPSGPASFRFAVGSCARVDSNGAVYDAIVGQDPLFYLALGDIHYGNIDSTDPAAHREGLERLLVKPGQAALYRQIPTAYVWDDHDYGPNDSDASTPGRSAVRQAYREVVPHYPLVHAGDGPINQAFTIGRVRFVLTDNRSERAGDSMLGAEQRRWLIDELTRAAVTHELVIWANPVPWISEPREGGDNWNGFAAERAEIADALAAARVDNLVMLSGDAHMVALDDGTNSDYSSGGTGGFPVLHAAALDRPGNVKGGPYSNGEFPGGGQYGMVDIVDDGDGILVTLSGHTWDGDELVAQTFSFD